MMAVSMLALLFLGIPMLGVLGLLLAFKQTRPFIPILGAGGILLLRVVMGGSADMPSVSSVNASHGSFGPVTLFSVLFVLLIGLLLISGLVALIALIVNRKTRVIGLVLLGVPILVIPLAVAGLWSSYSSAREVHAPQVHEITLSAPGSRISIQPFGEDWPKAVRSAEFTGFGSPNHILVESDIKQFHTNTDKLKQEILKSSNAIRTTFASNAQKVQRNPVMASEEFSRLFKPLLGGKTKGGAKGTDVSVSKSKEKTEKILIALREVFADALPDDLPDADVLPAVKEALVKTIAEEVKKITSKKQAEKKTSVATEVKPKETQVAKKAPPKSKKKQVVASSVTTKAAVTKTAPAAKKSPGNKTVTARPAPAKPRDTKVQAAAAERPDWLDAGSRKVGNAYQMVASAGPYKTLPECRRRLKRAILDTVTEYLDAQWNSEQQFAILSQLSPVFYQKELMKMEWIETIHSPTPGVGEMKTLHVLLEFDHKANAQFEELLRSAIVAKRMWIGALGLVMLLLVLSIAFGYLKIDMATQGAYRGRLTFATILLILLVLVVGPQVGESLYWMQQNGAVQEIDRPSRVASRVPVRQTKPAAGDNPLEAATEITGPAVVDLGDTNKLGRRGHTYAVHQSYRVNLFASSVVLFLLLGLLGLFVFKKTRWVGLFALVLFAIVGITLLA